jgi:LDH2 family malate/lactate/ureidoglycolate dehydrogenase
MRKVCQPFLELENGLGSPGRQGWGLEVVAEVLAGVLAGHKLMLLRNSFGSEVDRICP